MQKNPLVWRVLTFFLSDHTLGCLLFGVNGVAGESFEYVLDFEDGLFSVHCGFFESCCFG